MAIPQEKPSPAGPPSPALVYLTGVLLFLFIPLVLFLYVRHPEPVGVSLVAGVVLMIGHRFLARPYMARVLPTKCVWCNRVPARGPEGSTLELRTRGGAIQARCCPEHRKPAAKFFSFLHAWRWLLRLGIFVPLLYLLSVLAVFAAGRGAPINSATEFFKLIVGITVNVAAFGYLAFRERSSLSVPFPVHNFFLLGVRNLLWVFRLVGLWWIWQGLAFFLAR